MSSSSGKSALRYAAEALIVAPALALALAWSGFIVAGLGGLYDLQLHGVDVSWLLVRLAALAFLCFVAGGLLFAIDLARRLR